jgi:hypothetical protein
MMATLYRILVEFCWAAGVLAMLWAVVLRFVPALNQIAVVTPKGVLIFASTLFLCTLATREMETRTK